MLQTGGVHGEGPCRRRLISCHDDDDDGGDNVVCQFGQVFANEPSWRSSDSAVKRNRPPRA